jgi:hypothetical protein
VRVRCSLRENVEVAVGYARFEAHEYPRENILTHLESGVFSSKTHSDFAYVEISLRLL